MSHCKAQCDNLFKVMGAIYESFEHELASWRKKYAGQPRRELIRLFLLALEREELVSVGYREDLMLQRLERMPLAGDVKELIHHALVWAWKDEEMHAIYIRGAILKLGNRWLSTKAFLRQMAGALGGWSASTQQHVSFSQAPLARTISATVTWIGGVTGQVPEDVREYLRFRPFRDFCLFNVDAEKTAWLCWNRIAELARDQADVTPRMLDDFGRVLSDEERHERIFQILAESLDAEDRLKPGESSQSLSEKIGAVGECFLPRSLRPKMSDFNPLGSGTPVWVQCGNSAVEKMRVFEVLLKECDFARQLEKRASILGRRVCDLRVAIKPTFMMGYHTKDRSTFTDPELVDALAAFLRTQGCVDVAVVEGRNIYDRFYANRGVEAVGTYLGFRSKHYRIVDSSLEQVPHTYFRGMAQYTVGRTWKEADFRISFGKMRSHPVEMALLTVGNLEWLGARCDEFMFVERQAHRETAIMMLIDAFPSHFAFLDAFENAPDGLAGVMGCPRPKAPRRIYASGDALALDTVAARHMGIPNVRVSCILRAAVHWFGQPSPSIEVIGTDTPIADWKSPHHNDFSSLLSLMAFPVYVFGSGRGAVFVPEMDEQAFPLLAPESFRLKWRRRFVQRLLGLRHPR